MLTHTTFLLSCSALHSEGRTGQFSFGSEVLPVTLLDLPCVVESYKTYDDNHLVKMCDVGQVEPLHHLDVHPELAQIEPKSC